MSMKPIASKKNLWCVMPQTIELSNDEISLKISALNDENYFYAELPDGLTFAQLLDQYNACTEAIYFID